MTQQASETQQPPCVLCAVWQRLPHAKRWSTPVPHDEAEACLTIGYWLRRSLEGSVARFCERHARTLETLDRTGLTDPSQLLAPVQAPVGAGGQAPQVQLTQSSVPPMPQQPTPGVHSTGAEQTQPVPGVLPTAAQLAPAAPKVVQPVPGVVPGGPLPQLLYDPNLINLPTNPVATSLQPTPTIVGVPLPGMAAAHALMHGATQSQAVMAEVQAHAPQSIPPVLVPGMIPGGPLPQLLYDPNEIPSQFDQTKQKLLAHVQAARERGDAPPILAAIAAVQGSSDDTLSPTSAAMLKAGLESAARGEIAPLSIPPVLAHGAATLPAIEGHPEAVLGQVPATCPLCKKPLEGGMHVCAAP